MAPPAAPRDVLAAIDVGTNAARLKVAERRADGSLYLLREQRDAIRPGEGVFRTGLIAPEVARRVVSTLRGFAHTCDLFGAVPRAVATSSFRDARNGKDVRARILEETGVDLEIISGQEEARLICTAVLEHAPERRRSMVIDIGGGSTEVTTARGPRPVSLASLPLGTVRLTELFDAGGKVGTDRLSEMRSHAGNTVRERLKGKGWTAPDKVFGSSGTIRSLAAFIGPKKSRAISRQKLTRALETLASLSARERRKYFEPSRADVIVSGAVVLEAVMLGLELEQVVSVDRGLRDGILIDLAARNGKSAHTGSELRTPA